MYYYKDAAKKNYDKYNLDANEQRIAHALEANKVITLLETL